ncbi:MAG: cyclic nucleotide-binding domain-containing protein [Candidatus Sericytochromatia bacterium]|nr:cyclic nucleotide-binding domain-containing protein [Candidatus Tanganyikabacteria bacterium]
MAALRIQPARTPEERAAVYAFRYNVYIDEMGKPMAEADHERKVVEDPADESGVVLAAYDGGEVVGSLRVNIGLESVIGDPRISIYDLHLFQDCAPERFAFASRFMVRRDFRGSIGAHRLTLAALDTVLAADVRLCFCYCAPYLVSFYEQLGFRRYTDNFNDELGYRVPMVLVLFDLAHLRAVHSPLQERMPPHPHGEDWESYFARRFPEHVLPANSRIVSTEEFYQLLNYKLHDDPLTSIGLLRGLEKAEAEEVLKAGTVINCDAGDVVIRAGEHSAELYLILSAMVGVRSSNTKALISVLGPGELLGEMAFFMGSTRTADVEVISKGELLVLSEKTLNHLMRHHPQTASKILYNLSRILCERLATTTRNLAEVVSPQPSPAQV